MDPLDKAIRPDEVKEIVFDQGRVILSTHNSVRAYGFQEIRSADMMIVTRGDPAGVREPVLRTIRIATNDGGSYDIPMGGVWNRPSWTNDTAGVAVAMEEIKQYIKKCCRSSGENEAPLKFSFSPYDQGSDLWTVTADEAGTYNAYTQDGSSGTITYSKNGGAFAALSGTIALAVGDTIQVKRTTITAAGWSRWQRQVTP